MTQKYQSPKDKIHQYLDTRAKEDPQFAANYAKPEKSFEQCWLFILGEAKKRAVNGTCFMDDEEVYGLAVHYYDEDNIEINSIQGNFSVAASSPGKNSKSVSKVIEEAERMVADEMKDEGRKPKPGKKPKAGKAVPPQTSRKRIVQLELFNFDEP